MLAQEKAHFLGFHDPRPGMTISVNYSARRSIVPLWLTTQAERGPGAARRQRQFPQRRDAEGTARQSRNRIY
jgi:hypothetical protein